MALAATFWAEPVGEVFLAREEARLLEDAEECCGLKVGGEDGWLSEAVSFLAGPLLVRFQAVKLGNVH